MSSFGELDILNLVFVFVLMLGITTAIELKDVKYIRKYPKAPAIAAFIQFILSPLTAFLLAKITDLEPHFAVAFVIVGSMPGGAMSNVFCLLFGFDLALSVAMTTISSLCSLFMLPLNIYIYVVSSDIIKVSDDFEIDYVGIGISALVVVFGTVVGLFVNFKLTSFHADGEAVVNIGIEEDDVADSSTAELPKHHDQKHEKTKRLIEWFGFQCGLGILVVSSIRNAQSDVPIWEAPAGVFVVVILFPIILAGFAFIFGYLFKIGSRPAIMAIALESSVQNTNIALPIVGLAIADPVLKDSAIGVPLLYAGVSAQISIGYSLVAWKLNWSNITPNENICTAFMLRYKFIGQATRLTCLFPCCWGDQDKESQHPA